MLRFWIVGLLLCLCSCSYFDNDVERGYQEDAAWHSATAGDMASQNYTGATFTTADVRIITKRIQPVTGHTVICIEPSPDVAEALSSSGSLTAKGGSTTVNGSLSVSAASAEAVDELAGRSTALLGLRDGLFEACEAYANGMIGQDAYALVLSRYGQLMTTLFLAQDITSASAAQSKAVTSPTLTSTTPSGDNGSSPSETTTPAPASTSNTSAEISAPDGTAHAFWASDRKPVKAQTISTTISPKAELIPTAVGGGRIKPQPVATPAAAAAGGKAKPKSDAPTTAANSGSTPSAGAAGGNATAATPLAIARMNEDYMHQGLLSALLVACINAGDPTRDDTLLVDDTQNRPSGSSTPSSLASVRAQMHNDWLGQVCTNLENPSSLMAMEKMDAADAYTAIDPGIAAVAAAQSGSGARQQTSTAKSTSDATVKAVQNALAKLYTQGICPGCYPGPVDGTNGPLTVNAVEAYESENMVAKNLKVDGKYNDPALLAALGIKAPA